MLKINLSPAETRKLSQHLHWLARYYKEDNLVEEAAEVEALQQTISQGPAVGIRTEV